MKYLSLFLCLFFVQSVAQADMLAPQNYSKNYMPYVEVAEESTITLSDGTLWKRGDESEDLSQTWQPDDQVIVRWENVKSKYVLQSLTENKSSDVDLMAPSDVKIMTINKDTLKLTDGSTFSYIPFLKKVRVGDSILMSLNENEQGKYYPYFIVGYSIEKGNGWEVTGEVQARLQN